MTAEDFKAIRALYGETQEQFGRRLGWSGGASTVKRKVIRYESGETPVVGPVAALLAILAELKRKGDTRRTRKGTSTKERKAKP